MKITIDENTKELIIEGTYTIAQLKDYLNLSGSLMDFIIIIVPEPTSIDEYSYVKVDAAGIITKTGNTNSKEYKMPPSGLPKYITDDTL